MTLNDLIAKLEAGCKVVYFEYFDYENNEDDDFFDYWIEVDDIELDHLIDLDTIIIDGRFNVTQISKTDIESWLIKLV